MVVPSTPHSRARGNPGLFSNELAWIPAFAGTTEAWGLVRSADHPRTCIFEGGHEEQEVRSFNCPKPSYPSRSSWCKNLSVRNALSTQKPEEPKYE